MNRIGFFLVALTRSSAHCTSQSVQPVVPKVEKPPPPPLKELEVPVGFQLVHFGQGAELRTLIKAVDPQLFNRWTKGDLIVLRRDQSMCVFLRLGHQIETISPCPRPEGVPVETQKIALKPTLFGQALHDGSVVLKPGSVKGSAWLSSQWLRTALQSLGLPQVDLADMLELRAFAQSENSGFALEFKVAEDLLERLGRFDLAKRYGGFADYVRDVRAWGDGTSFQWIVRLDEGGAGLRLDGRRLRLAVQTGSVWKEQLDTLLRATQTQSIQFPILTVPNLAVAIDDGVKLRLVVEQKPLPTRPVLRQLTARLARWLAKAEEEQ